MRPGDYDGDGKADLVVFRPTDLRWYTLPSGRGVTNGTSVQFGLSGDVPVAGDYDGDGKNDRAVFRRNPTSASWFIFLSSAGTLITRELGFTSDIPVPGEYDGDGKTDLAVYRPSDGTWSFLESSRKDAPAVTVSLGHGGDKNWRATSRFWLPSCSQPGWTSGSETWWSVRRCSAAPSSLRT